MEKLEQLMAHHRVRPSLIAGLAPTMLATAALGFRLTLGEETTHALLRGLEKGMQDEHDEQLRLLNEKDLKMPELRQLLVHMRDSDPPHQTKDFENNSAYKAS